MGSSRGSIFEGLDLEAFGPGGLWPPSQTIVDMKPCGRAASRPRRHVSFLDKPVFPVIPSVPSKMNQNLDLLTSFVNDLYDAEILSCLILKK